MKESKTKTTIIKNILILTIIGVLCLLLLVGCIQNNKTSTTTTNDNKPLIGIIAAMDQEYEGIKDRLENPEATTAAGTQYHKGYIGNFNVIVAKCGVGKVNAAICTQCMIDTFQPDYVINTGTAGALSPELNVGDIVIATSAAEWDLNTTALGYPPGFIDSLNKTLIDADPDLTNNVQLYSQDASVSTGLIVSGDQFVSTDAQRASIKESFPDAKCAEMEGAAIAHTCAQNDVPFCIIRCISDTADGNSSVDYNTFAEEAGKWSASNIIHFLENCQMQ